MNKEIINSNQAPAPIGPYNQAVKAGNLLFLSGQVCMDPETGELKNSSVAEETAQVMKNLDTVLKAAGATFENVVKTSIFLTDMSLFATVNEEYGKHFQRDYPARETVAVKALPRNVNVEISMIASV
ncbi:MAG: RidA family protein [Chitinophagaceae bacterium]|nr:RidA family protein [Chitinophagaceae bacterium]